MMPRPARLAVIAVSVMIGVGVGFVVHKLFIADDPNTGQVVRSLGQATIGGPFTLVDQDERTRRDTEFRGRLMLVDFGYTNCPDVCPIGLQLMADALEKLGRDADKVQPIFVTIDPARDTPAILKDYVGHFSDRILGLTGTPEQIAEAARAYRVYYKAHGDPAKDPNYPVDHSTFLYLMGRDGSFITHFSHDAPPERVVEAIKRQL